MRAGLPVYGRTGHSIGIFQTAAAVAGSIAIEHFIVLACLRHPHAIAETRDRGKVAGKYEGLIRVFRTTHERYNAIVGIMDINPREALRDNILLAKSRFAPVQQIQVAHKITELGMMRVAGRLTQVPVQTLLEVPLVPLPKFAAHEEQFLPRMPVHVAEKCA